LVARLADEARTDELTGLLNRRGFNERAPQAMALALRQSVPISLVAFDIDHFKRINDQWGHDAGDRVLATIGDLLCHEARNVDLVARRGGEEFAALLPGSDADGAETFAERIRSALATNAVLPVPNVRVSAGIVATTGDDGLPTLLERADLALYQAKREGRDRIVVFDGLAQPA
jgi:diguanylate cyclase (GGDEF)-like protein